jgi:NADH-quinone oxidoreductase subunit M
MLFTMASVGLPGTSGFVGEFLVMVGAFQASTWLAALITTGIILGAAYMLWLYRRVIFGPLVKEELKSLLDLSPREVAVFAPLVLLVLWMGIYPSSFTEVYDASIASLLEDYRLAASAQPGLNLAGGFAR